MRDDQENMYKQIQEAISNLPDNFSILEEQIDVELQLQYFNFSKELRNKFSTEYILNKKDDLFDENVSHEEKKNLLVLLASINEVAAYRAIEKFVKNPEKDLKEWAVLALQESRMLLQSSLLDEQQVFISTGLGGQGQKLRYFSALRAKDYHTEFTEVQRQLISSELEFNIKKHEGILEEIIFDAGFAKILFLIPLKTNIQDLFLPFIEECNQYGNFLDDDVILTNVRKLSTNEILEFLENNTNEESDE